MVLPPSRGYPQYSSPRQRASFAVQPAGRGDSSATEGQTTTQVLGALELGESHTARGAEHPRIIKRVLNFSKPEVGGTLTVHLPCFTCRPPRVVALSGHILRYQPVGNDPHSEGMAGGHTLSKNRHLSTGRCTPPTTWASLTSDHPCQVTA